MSALGTLPLQVQSRKQAGYSRFRGRGDGDTGEGRLDVANPDFFGQSRGLLGAALEAATEVGGSRPVGPGEFEGQPR